MRKTRVSLQLRPELIKHVRRKAEAMSREGLAKQERRGPSAYITQLLEKDLKQAAARS